MAGERPFVHGYRLWTKDPYDEDGKTTGRQSLEARLLLYLFQYWYLLRDCWQGLDSNKLVTLKKALA
jgi:hypothetical protein